MHLAENGAIKCPECRTTEVIVGDSVSHIRNMPRNHAIVRAIEEQSVTCEMCEKYPSEWMCESDACSGLKLCVGCTISHQSLKRFMEHTTCLIVDDKIKGPPTPDGLMPAGSTLKFEPKCCSKHGRELNLFCQTHSTPTCVYNTFE